MLGMVEALRRVLCWQLLLVLCMACTGGPAWAQVPATAVAKPAPARKPAATRPAAAASAAVAVPAAPAVRSGEGWRVGPHPAWVQPVPGEPAEGTPWPAPKVAADGGRRDLLWDAQQRYGQGKPQFHFRQRVLVTQSQALGQASQWQVNFNPAFQTVVLHEAVLWRDGKRLDRLADARIELVRREQRLEQQVIDGTQTLLLVLNDVRVGEPVELSYTLEGENPIYEGRIDTGAQLASEVPVDLLHLRIEAPAERMLQARVLATTLEPERLTEGGRQVIRVLRRDVAPVRQEQGTPPWIKVFPALDVTEYRSWAEVDAWAQRLFALPATPHADIAARAAAFQATGKTGEALVAEVLRFVQDEIRYFSVSLGESSHRPKAPEQTLAERLGDCKDKVMLLNALLRALGFEARPALVSMQRNRGLAQFLPSHGQFDHVVTHLRLDGTVRFLDATISGQGGPLAVRGYLPYGLALVVGQGEALQPAMPPASALNELHFEQRWDLSQPGKPARLAVVLRARGLVAEGMRSGVAQGGLDRLAESIGGAHTRVQPGLRRVGEARLSDDRDSNTLQVQLDFEHADLGEYELGSMLVEFNAIELSDMLVGPAEQQRRTPFLIEQPALATSRIEVITPQPMQARPPAPTEVADRHFRLAVSTEVQDKRLALVRRYERRSDEVLPADLPAFRENLIKARQQLGSRLRLAVLEPATLDAVFNPIGPRVRSSPGFRDDNAARLQIRQELALGLATQVLLRTGNDAPLAQRVRAERALNANLLGSFDTGLSDAELVLKKDASSANALEARAVALVGLGRLEDSLPAFEAMAAAGKRSAAQHWMGAVQLSLGRAAAAEALFREVVASGGGDEREFALLWLFLSAERQGLGRGREAIAPHVASADAKKLTGALLLHFDGQLSREALMKVVSGQREMARPNEAEAYFYLGQWALAKGQADEAQRAFKQVLATGVVMYRETTFARLENQRSGAAR